MKARPLLIAALAAQAASVYAQTPTNAAPVVPLDEIAAARTTVREPEMWRISTNTPAFEQYGVGLMLSVANQMAEKWKLDLPHPLRVSDIVFWLKPKATSIQWGFNTRDGRYGWDSDEGWVKLFRDDENSSRAYYPSRGRTNAYDILRQMALTKNRLTEKQAIQMARDSLHALGFTERQLRLHEPPRVEYRYFTEADGKKHKVPLFAVGWSVEQADPDSRLVEITISGITTNIVEYFNADPNTPRIPLPPSYFQMLGLPTNYLDTLSPKARRQLGLPPLSAQPR